MNTNCTERRDIQDQFTQMERLSSSGMLAAGVAHEINNPLSSAIYHLESVANELEGHLHCMGRIRRALGVDALAEIVGEDRRMLEFSSLNDMRQQFQDALIGTHRILVNPAIFENPTSPLFTT